MFYIFDSVVFISIRYKQFISCAWNDISIVTWSVFNYLWEDIFTFSFPISDLPISSSSPVPVTSIPGDKLETVPTATGEVDTKDVLSVTPKTIEKLESNLNKIKLVLQRDPTSKQWVSLEDNQNYPLEGQVKSD